MVRHTADSSPDFIIHGHDGSIAIAQAKSGRKRTRVKVGSVFVSGDKASAAEVKRAVELSAEALNRMSEKISKPGVRLYQRKDIPLFSVDPEDPERIVRKLNGKIELGVFENGQFTVAG